MPESRLIEGAKFGSRLHEATLWPCWDRHRLVCPRETRPGNEAPKGEKDAGPGPWELLANDAAAAHNGYCVSDEIKDGGASDLREED